MNQCTIDGCDNPIKAKGLCSMHHQRWYRYGDPLYQKFRQQYKPLNPVKPNVICSIEDCNKMHTARGFCRLHYREWYKSNKNK
ncbi:hypothetical protein DFP97_12269 [Paenibacillus prosopidis]|uniref:Uncharacterized protein n=1 Tax=Paenibacillus prosopidis TaxID=630520 RepID=A0A368VJ95_9BACL|nr:hypothetical protein DFP97_12269 [Paenibacillus prosopidis]